MIPHSSAAASGGSPRLLISCVFLCPVTKPENETLPAGGKLLTWKGEAVKLFVFKPFFNQGLSPNVHQEVINGKGL